MWVFLLGVMALSMYFLLGNVVQGNAPALGWLFPGQHDAPQARPSFWQLELSPGDANGSGGDWRLTLPARSDLAGVVPTLVLTCVDGGISAHINPATEVDYHRVNGVASTDLIFDGTLKRTWEQGKDNLLFPPNAKWFVERALAARAQLAVEAPLPKDGKLTATFQLDGLDMYQALLSRCGVTLPKQASAQPASGPPPENRADLAPPATGK